MPIKAKLKGEDIFAFNFDEEAWLKLRDEPVEMHCCPVKATLKKSKLGTRFFSHRAKGDCASQGESAEHLYLKNLICTIASDLGWHAETEREGRTPQGEAWVADVYCENGKAKLVFEVQWSPQTNDEFLRRQQKYAASGLRAAWLFRLKSNKEYWARDMPYHYDTPVFGMKRKSKKMEDLYVPQFGESVESFVRGMLQGHLEWAPKPGQPLVADVIPHYENCWKCKKETGLILGIEIRDKRDKEIGFGSLNDDGVPELILKGVPPETLAKAKIGAIKKRFSKAVGGSYLSNGCYHCDVLMGGFFISEVLMEMHDGLPKPLCSFQYAFDENCTYIESEWRFNGKRSKHIF